MKKNCVAHPQSSERDRTNVSFRTAALMAAGAVGIFYGGMYAARATPGGEVRKGLSFAGTLTGVSGKQTLTFTFTNKTTGVTCVVPSKDTHENGSFVAELPIDACPANLFDGGDVTYSVKVGGDTLPGEFNVNPVPYAKYAEQAGTPDCPAGYSRDLAAPGFENGTGKLLCKKGTDEVVRVGAGATAFWIDRYEASVWQTPEAISQFGADRDDYPATFPDNGQWTKPIYAISKAKAKPSAFITWFQAAEACEASGKRLPSVREWLRAARGTPDPGTSNGDGGNCRTQSAVTRKSGDQPSLAVCASAWGAEEMIGNLEEWGSEWFAGLGDATQSATPWPATQADYGMARTVNISSKAIAVEGGSPPIGVPAAPLLGGSRDVEAGAGIFALNLDGAPSLSSDRVGFRCVIPR